MKRLPVTIALIIYGICAMSGAESLDSLISALDRAIADRPVYIAEHRRAITLAHHRLEHSHDDSARFKALCELHDLYQSFNTDSSLLYSRQSLDTARQMGIDSLVQRGRLNVADVLATAGMYREAIDIIDSISPASLPTIGLRKFYFHVSRTVYGLLADYSIDPAVKRNYTQLTNAYRDSLIHTHAPGSLMTDILRADRMIAFGSPDSAITVLLNREADIIAAGKHDQAIIAYTLSKAYEALGDTRHQKEALAMSATADMKSGIREYLSLLELAQLLYRDGDIDHAYRYLTTTLDDAAQCNARLRIIQVNDIFPVVNQMYNAKISNESRRLRITILAVIVLALSLIALAWRLRRQMRKVSYARASLRELNNELQAANVRLSQANQAIAENSKLKTEYIARYMNQCSSYIDRLDSQRKGIARLLSVGKLSEANRLVNSSAAVNAQLEEFYRGFDEAFLNLFPTFVDDFNSLLCPEWRITPKAEGQLTTELRIYALIRLGINDSNRISQFLRYSVTTIYNYRTRTRNRALGDRNLFESKVMLIGRFN